MTTGRDARTKIETWRNCGGGEGWGDGQTKRVGHMGKRDQTTEKHRSRERTPSKTRRSQRRNQRIKWDQHTQRETRGEGEMSWKKLGDLLYGKKGGKAGRVEGWSCRGERKRLDPGVGSQVRTEVQSRCLSRNLGGGTNEATE